MNQPVLVSKGWRLASGKSPVGGPCRSWPTRTSSRAAASCSSQRPAGPSAPSVIAWSMCWAFNLRPAHRQASQHCPAHRHIGPPLRPLVALSTAYHRSLSALKCAADTDNPASRGSAPVTAAARVLSSTTACCACCAAKRSTICPRLKTSPDSDFDSSATPFPPAAGAHCVQCSRVLAARGTKMEMDAR